MLAAACSCLQLPADSGRLWVVGVRALDKSAFAGPLLNVDPPSSIVQPTVPATTGFSLAFVSVSVELGTGIGRRTVKPKRTQSGNAGGVKVNCRAQVQMILDAIASSSA